MILDLLSRRVLNIAHRGARSLAPENTLAAGLRAVSAGADLWEIDVGMTGDGELVVMHDGTLERTSNAPKLLPGRSPWHVHTTTLEEIRRLDFGSWFVESDPFGQISSGAVSGAEAEGYRGERAPTLRDALLFTLEHSWAVNIEIKSLRGKPGDATVAERVVRLVDELEMTERVLISSFNLSYLERVRKASPAIAVGVLANRRRRNPLSLLRSVEGRAYHPRFDTLEAGEAARLVNEDLAVLVWVVNDEETMLDLIVNKKVTGIFTDFPQTLTQLLKKLGQ